MHVNENWLSQAVDYIIGNAKRAMTSSRDKRLTITTRSASGHVEIDFTDTGCGMPADLMNRLTTAPILPSEGAKGTGLGLLIASSVLQTYDGRIDPVSSSTEDPTGTTMRIKLPVFEPDIPTSASPERPA